MASRETGRMVVAGVSKLSSTQGSGGRSVCMCISSIQHTSARVQLCLSLVSISIITISVAVVVVVFDFEGVRVSVVHSAESCCRVSVRPTHVTPHPVSAARTDRQA
ncbi:hypothetical protein K437DRAFT_85196 [Tilletiaria anomala UBC 951]|uniref:Uncharacterized protein n=1 Tax=Tilletiaria anomala (strain ATCC 24038 / CBS 436.72 / UBC 951) TaxID=1037660 RepID=A0A066V8Q9_TILAU|nr:uncharacterized protein K437DRAFT_85196 [Tilletiaria anomala UBC 951]KDN34985.1 hypothetical protein K437DRAFT_85196 [Tilletiaria anomala UBC 951]